MATARPRPQRRSSVNSIALHLLSEMEASEHTQRRPSSAMTIDDYDEMSMSSRTSNALDIYNQNGRPAYVDPQVAVKEEKRVWHLKLIMILVLMLVAAGMCAATYVFLTRAEEEEFNSTFEGYASEILAVSKSNVESTFVSIEALANSVSSYAKASGQEWPYVVVPDWTSRAVRTAELAAGARLVTMAPLVKASQRKSFEQFASGVIYDQIQEDLDYLNIGVKATEVPGIPERISWINISSQTRAEEPEVGPFSSEFLVNWQRYPFEVEKGRVFVMNNMLRVPTIRGAVSAANITKTGKAAFFEAILGVESQVIQPIFRDVLPPHRAMEREVVGVVWVVMGWGKYFVNLLPEGANGTIAVLESSCGFIASYEINGLGADFLGLVDAHDPKYDSMEIEEPFFSFGEDATNTPEEICIDELTLRLYPSDTLREATTTNRPAIYTALVAAIFVVTTMVFLVYDWAVRSYQIKVMARVVTQDKIVSHLFPTTIRDRLYGIGDRRQAGVSSSSDGDSFGQSSRELHVLEDGPGIFGSKPIADLFLETTVFMADIAGFTAWSSAREPSQVFVLLEHIYGAFDKMAHRHGVFKVETIGDCYVAVAGLPEPRKDHAVAMAKFARDCMDKMDALTAKLEISLGPGTGDLDVRIGLHSGQVTAGVLRGERSRFQLFGDTVNVAARMESTGERRKIQISSDTAELLKSQGRSKWIKPRGDTLIQGKGRMKTYWLETKAESEARNDALQKAHAMEELGMDQSSRTAEMEEDERSDGWMEEDDDIYASSNFLSKKERLIEWNVEILSDLLRRIVAARTETKAKSLAHAEEKLIREGTTVLEEFEEIITLPRVTIDDLRQRKDPDCIMLNESIVDQLRGLIRMIADLYRENAFHSFEHASHVTASVAKLLSRIVTTDTTRQTHGPEDLESADISMHSYGITSDPLTQFAVVFSAIIHDADHPGVPNAQLLKEESPWVSKYKGKSLAEQNSVDLVWGLLMRPEHTDLRACIYTSEAELGRFRQLVVNSVMATDIADKELGQLRKARWNTAFSEETSSACYMDRKATIVLEHLIQASDVSHTMQHWQVYKKWNHKYFRECYGAYKSGRAEKDPSIGWYEGEIGFFVYYIIPLAKKLDSCGVFGVSSHEYLNYATANLEEWKRKGEDIVRQYVAEYSEVSADSSSSSECLDATTGTSKGEGETP